MDVPRGLAPRARARTHDAVRVAVEGGGERPRARAGWVPRCGLHKHTRFSVRDKREGSSARRVTRMTALGPRHVESHARTHGEARAGLQGRRGAARARGDADVARGPAGLPRARAQRGRRRRGGRAARRGSQPPSSHAPVQVYVHERCASTLYRQVATARAASCANAGWASPRSEQTGRRPKPPHRKDERSRVRASSERQD